MKSKKMVFTGGGTGGHVYPAKPIIEEFRSKGIDPLWIGSKNGMEEKIVSSWNLSYKGISTGKLRRYFSFRNFTDIFRIIAGFFQSLGYLKKHKPVALFSKGGFVSVPPVLAAWCLRIPVYTHDSDVDPGLATRINSRFAKKIFVAYPKCLNFYKEGLRRKVVVSGNPVRDAFFDQSIGLSETWQDKLKDQPLVMVLGGSQGARQINSLIVDILPDLKGQCIVVHQTGAQDSYTSDKPEWIPVKYIYDDLAPLLRRADLVISRGGAGSLWEYAATGLPSIIIPLRSGSRGDQIRNAEIFNEAGCSLLLEKEDSETLKNMVLSLLSDAPRLASMKKSCQAMIENRAEKIIFTTISQEIL